ncbi:MAG: tRNA (adenosine(37)-N6)-threonylcarbamoyltransferase complex dimerization subunit type 1 TsaB [Oscillospiraceae bacterium]
MLILGIDTSGHTASAAVCDENRVLAQSSVMTKLTHSQIILPMAKRVLSDAGVTLDDIGVVSAAKGPGSYTGLRIGLAAVKGIAFANGCRCAGISTLEALAYNFLGMNCSICAVMAARQNLVYNALFRVSGRNVERLCDDRIISVEELSAELIAGDDVYYGAGDYADEMAMKAPERVFPAPPQLKYPLASSLCFAAFDRGTVPADKLDPEYLQITKAEKDLQEKENKQ